MVDTIDVNPNWDDEESLMLLKKFNRCVSKRFFSSISKIIERMLTLLNKNEGKQQQETAEILHEIAKANPQLISVEDQNQLSIFLLTGEFPKPRSKEEIEDLFASANEPKEKHPDTKWKEITPKSFYYRPPTSFKIGATPDTSFQQMPITFSAQKFQEYSEYQVPENITDSPETQFEVWSEDDYEPSKDDSPLVKTVKELKLINIRRVKKKEMGPLLDRKCALGDGKFEGYQDEVYECKCGTLYHEICVKTQAIFVGMCHICDIPFKK